MLRLCVAFGVMGLALGLGGRAAAADGKPPAAGEAAAWKEPSGEDWPGFLGPSGNGITRDPGIAEPWPEKGPPVLWTKPLDEGYASVSVRGGKLIGFYGANTGETVECLRADTGAPLWKYEYSGSTAVPYYGDGPRASPVLSANRCYTVGLSGQLLCLDLETGKPVWSRELPKDFDIVFPPFGLGPSPILEGDLLIVAVGGRPNSGVVAFRAATGEVAWRAVGKETWDGVETGRKRQPRYRWTGNEELISYSSPLAVTIHGKRQILCLMRQGLVSLDPQDGHLNFKYWFSPRMSNSAVAARPVVFDDRIFLTASYRLGCVLLEVDASCKSVKPLWSGGRPAAHWSTPIYFEGYLYGFGGREEGAAALLCLDSKTGKPLWETRGYDTNRHDLVLDRATGAVKNRTTKKVVPFPFFGRGSLTLVGRKCLILGERGTLALAELSPKGYREVCRASVPGIKFPSWQNPVLAGKRLYIRDTKRVVCLDLSPHP
jgi:outer membrane protein assembly factor BamB